MKFREAWRLSKTPYLEVAFRSAQLSRMGNQSGFSFSRTTPEQRFRSIIRSTRISKVVFTIFTGIGSGFPFFQYILPSNHNSVVLVSAISLSLLISLGYLILYLFQILPSFNSSEPYTLLSTLPLQPQGFSLVAFLSFVRTFDWQVLCALGVQMLAVGFATHSVAAVALMFVASLVNSTFGIFIAVFLSRVFYQNITRGGRSLAASISRIVFLITWGIAVMSLGFFFDFLPYLTTYIDRAVRSNLLSPAGEVLALVHPFSSALVITSTIYPSLYGSTALNNNLRLLSFVMVAFYLGLGIVVGRRTINVVSSVARGGGVSIIRKAAKEFSIHPRFPLLAYVLKDLRMATKSTATAFLFGFPIFEVVIVFFSFSSVSRFSATTIFSSTAVGLFFILFMSSALLNTEASAIDFTVSLPLRPSTIVNAKALITVFMYLPVPLAILFLSHYKPISSPVLIFVPFIEALAVASAGAAQIGLFIVGHRKVVVSQIGEKKVTKSVGVFEPSGFSLMGSRDVIRLATSIGVGLGLLAIPIAAYGITYFALTNNHLLALISMFLAGVVELALVEFIMQR